MNVLHRLVDQGNTVLVIEHHIDVVKQADHIIDLGPLGGDRGGRVVAQGTPEEVAQTEDSQTGRYLQRVLGRRRNGRRDGRAPAASNAKRGTSKVKTRAG
jgi:excinuclease ABC subunit A